MIKEVKILVIDDNIADSTILKRLFNKLHLWKTNLKMVATADEGILTALNFSPDIIFIDYLLGGETGIEFIKKIKEHEIDASLVLLTGFGSESVVTQALRAGVNDYLNKSELTTDLLDRTLRHHTHKLETERRLKQTEKTLKNLIENTDTGFVVFDNNGIIKNFNQPFERLLGCKADEVKGANLKNRLQNDEIEKFNNAIEKCLNDGRLSDFETIFVKPDGEKIYVAINATKEKSNNELLISALCRNITERKIAELHLKQAKEKAEQADKIKTEFLENMSHEIRTPMNAITGFASILDSQELTKEKQKEYTTYIRESSDNLLQLINDIVDAALIEAGQLEMKFSAVDINQVLYEMESWIKNRMQLLKRGNIKVMLKGPKQNESLSIKTERTRFKQILRNLLDNALKFTESGYIEFGYTKVNNELLMFYVKDSGIGITEEAQQWIFKKFRKLGKYNRKIYSGTGLGLPISKYLVENLGGEIWVETSVGQGSVFYFTIPIKEAVIKQKQAVIIPKDIPDLSGKTILIAEDEKSNYLFLKEALIGTNANLLWARDGIETLELCDKNKPDLILMDMKMPDMDGYTASKTIKEKYPDIPIIAQTAYAMSHDEERILQANIDDYIAKPIMESVLYDKIKKWINKM